MSVTLEIITTVERLKEIQSELAKQTYVAYDTETTGGDVKRHEIIGFSVSWNEDISFYIVHKEWDKEHQCLRTVIDKESIIAFLVTLSDKELVMHNALFDCAITRTNFSIDLMPKVHTDTMILAHLLDENRRCGLEELSQLELKESKQQDLVKTNAIANGGIFTKETYELYKADTDVLGTYGAKDAWLTYRLFLHLVPQLFDQKLDKYFYEDECMPLLRGPTYELNTVGLKVDRDRLIQLKKTLEAECMEAKAFIYKEIHEKIKTKYPGTNKKNQFNIGSSSQLSWLVFGEYNLEFGNLTKVGKEVCRALGLKLPYTRGAKREFIHFCLNSIGTIYQPEAIVNGKKVKAKKVREPWYYIACNNKTLKKLSSKYEWIDKLLEYQKKTKLLSTYVEGIDSRINYGIIQPAFIQIGTKMTRYSSKNPNFQNLPRDDKRIKDCIVARPGKVFVGADQSQLEPRVFAYTSQDKRLMESFAAGQDFYSVIGMEVFDKLECVPLKEGPSNAFGTMYPDFRTRSKTISLAATYGASAYQLAQSTGKSVEETQEDINNYFEKFQGVQEMMLKSHEQAKKHGVVYTVFGRPRRIPDAKKIQKLYGNVPHSELPYEARKLLNLAVNAPIQGTAGNIMNRAAIRYCNLKNDLKLDAPIVLQVHDSLVVECNKEDAETVALLLEEAMVNTATLPGVALEAIPKIGQTLAEV